MNGYRFRAAGLAVLLLPMSCAKPLDLCADQASACLTVEVTGDPSASVDLLRALYTVGTATQQENQFQSPPGGSSLPAGFELSLATSGSVNLNVIAELNLHPTLRGSAQLTIADGEHQQVTIPLTADLSNLPYVGPTPRHHAGIVLFPQRKAVVLFGGIGGDGTYLGDTWELDLGSGTWSAQTAPGQQTPAARTATLAYDPMFQRVVLAGGAGPSGMAVQDLWSYDVNGTWTQAAINSGGGNRTTAGMTVTDSGIAIVAGGIDSTGTILQDVVSFDPAAVKVNGTTDFITHVVTPPLPRIKTPILVSSSVISPSSVYLLGADEAAPSSGISIWQLSGNFSLAGSMLMLTPLGAIDSSNASGPSRRTDYSVATDSSGGFIYLFGGLAAPTGESLQDTYVFSLINRQWARVTTMANPLARSGAQLAFLPPAVLLLGGLAATGSTPPIALDTWKLTISPFAAPTVPGVFVRQP